MVDDAGTRARVVASGHGRLGQPDAEAAMALPARGRACLDAMLTVLWDSAVSSVTAAT